jgi:Winged helix-turn helix
MARIVEHLSVAELEARYRAARDVTEARHFQAIWLLAQGRTFLEVAEVLAFVPRWLEEFGGPLQCLWSRGAGRSAAAEWPPCDAADRSGAGRPGRAVEGAARGWRAVGGPKVAAWMARHLGLAKVHPQRGWEALQRLDWSLQAPRPRHARAATAAERAAFKGGSKPLSPRPKRRIPTGRSRSGPRMSTASG